MVLKPDLRTSRDSQQFVSLQKDITRLRNSILGDPGAASRVEGIFFQGQLVEIQIKVRTKPRISLARSRLKLSQSWKPDSYSFPRGKNVPKFHKKHLREAFSESQQ